MGPANQDDNREHRRKRLGRGINALLGDSSDADETPTASPVSSSGNDLLQIECARIESNPFQPRQQFDESALDELAESIRLHGILQPLLVRPLDGGYQLIAGERRLLAARKAGLTEVPCRVLTYGDQQVCEAALEENLKREDLHDLEKAKAFQEYIKAFGTSIEELARRLSSHRSTVSNLLRLLELPQSTQQVLLAGKISSGHARAILPLEEDEQRRICGKIEAEGWSVRRTEQAVRERQSGSTVPFEKKPSTTSAPTLSNHVLSLQNQLRDLTGLKVTIKQSGKEAGQVILHFESNDDFDRILRAFRRPAA